VNDNEGVYAEFRSSVKSLTEKAVTREYILECERDRRPPLEVLKRVADQGWLELGITKKGEIPDYVATAILLEELSYGYFGAGDLAYRALIHAANTIGKFAKESIRGEYLERVAKGTLLCSAGVTEPDSGSDAASIRTRAVKDGSDYIINGHKIFNSGMHFVDYAVCYTRTSVGERRHDGITALLVPAKSPGIRVSILDTAGHRSSAACEVW
jgi:alkylation response protein AidB-like acyl-CoA dehydrogenase